VFFENSPIGPSGELWNTTTLAGYSYTTSFIVPTSGYYLMTYKIDVKSGSGILPSNYTNVSTVLTNNGTAINGSTTLVQAPQENHIYTVSNTVLSYLTVNDSISLLYWSNEINTHIGSPLTITGVLPNNILPIEATASLVFTRIT